jgi:hypothetical protein
VVEVASGGEVVGVRIHADDLPRRQVYKLDLSAVRTSLKELNASTSFVAAEAILHEHFGDARSSLAEGRAASLVVLVDGLWGTQLFREAGAADRIAERVTRRAALVCSTLDLLDGDDLVQDPSKTYKAAKALLPILMGERGTGTRQNYSFASKFLHWCSPKHFPIMDAKARTALHRFQRIHAVTKNAVLSSTATMGNLSYLEEYERWIQFYGDLISSLTAHQVGELIDADFRSQPAPLATRNSVLRVLDKHFYFEGGGRGLGRLKES